MVAAREIAGLLGGEKGLGHAVHSLADLASAVESGLPGNTIRKLVSQGLVTAREISDSMRIPERTLMRMQQRERMPLDESDKIYRLAYIIALATKAIGDPNKAHTWLRRKNRALGGDIPLAVIGTEPGLRQVEQILGRIEYGGIS